jgi:chemotaxis protein CheD
MTALSARAARPPRAPAALADFAHIGRHWDRDHRQWSAKILPGQYYVTRSDELVDTVLGSSVAACIRDPLAGVGGMNRFMLPETAERSSNAWLDPKNGLATRYGSYAMESLINDLLKHGAQRARLEVKLFGGGRIIDSSIDVGACTIAFAREFVHVEGLTVAAEDLGDNVPRKVVCYPLTGPVRLKRLNALDRARENEAAEPRRADTRRRDRRWTASRFCAISCGCGRCRS